MKTNSTQLKPVLVGETFLKNASFYLGREEIGDRFLQGKENAWLGLEW